MLKISFGSVALGVHQHNFRINCAVIDNERDCQAKTAPQGKNGIV